MFVAKQYRLVLDKKTQVAKDTWTFYFERPEGYDFFPGQYNRVTLPIEAEDDRGNNRQFTISSSPTEKKYLTITTKIISSDFKKAFSKVMPGEQVQFFGPLGGFYLRAEDPTPRVLLAGGIGITPFRSMIKFVSDKSLKIPLTLIVSFSTAEDMIFYEELQEISIKKQYFKIIYSISNRHPGEQERIQDLSRQQQRDSGRGQNDKFEKGRISEQIINKYVTDFQNSEFLITGPPAMVDSTFEILQGMQIPEKNIKVEHFTGY